MPVLSDETMKAHSISWLTFSGYTSLQTTCKVTVYPASDNKEVISDTNYR